MSSSTPPLRPDDPAMSDPADTVTLLRETVHRYPAVDAFIEASGERITYAGWDAAADGVAAALADRGVVPGDVVCLMLPSSIRYMICYQAAMRLGAITTGLNVRLGPSEISHIFASAAPRVTVVDAGEERVLPPDAGSVVEWPALESWVDAGAPPLPELGPDHPVVICWTGGTTGHPKGVLFDHRNLEALAVASGALSAELDRRLSPLSFAHVGTMTRAWDEICRGITTVITPSRWTAPEALRLIEEHRVTVAQGVPTQWELMLGDPAFPGTDLSSLRLAASGGSRVPPDLLERMRTALGVPIINRYASTEAAIISGSRPDDPDEVIIETLGRPDASVELRIVDDDDQEVGSGIVGRVQVRSGAVMRGYWQDPEATAAVLSADGWLTVGDLGTLDEAGNLRFMGRMGDSYLRGGYNIYPVEVERELAEHPGVGQVAVVALPDQMMGEIGVAFVVSTVPVASDELKGWVRGRLANYKTPDHVFFVDEFRLTTQGKIDRRSLVVDGTSRLADLDDA